MSWNFETKNCSQRSCGVKESGVSASFPAAKRGVLVECTGSRGLQIDCPPNSLSRIKNSLVPGSPAYDFRAGMVGCEALKIKKLIFFPGMDQQSAATSSSSTMVLQSEHGTWRPVAGARTAWFSGSQIHSPALSHPGGTAPVSQGAPTCPGHPKGPRGLQKQTVPSLGSGGQGWEEAPA